MWKGYNVTTGYTKGVPFLSKMVHTKGKGLVPGAEPLHIKLQWEPPPPPPLWVTVTVVWFFSLISLILCLPLYTYSCVCLLKNILALQSFASHHLCETLDSLFPKLQTACLKAYQPPSNKLPTSATLMMWCLMVGALQYYWIKLIKQLDNINWFKVTDIFSFTLSLKYFSLQ